MPYRTNAPPPPEPKSRVPWRPTRYHLGWGYIAGAVGLTYLLSYLGSVFDVHVWWTWPTMFVISCAWLASICGAFYMFIIRDT